MTIYEQTGLSIMVSSPLLAGGFFIDTFQDQFSDYRHEISADGGYITANFNVRVKMTALEDWFDNGLGRDIKVYSTAGRIVWEGFINRLTITVGGYKISRGALLDLANRVQVSYSPVDNNADVPVYGNRVMTTTLNNTQSQAKYGIWHKILSGGQLKDNVALNLARTYLAENGYPATSQDLQFGGSEPSIAIECLGYVNWLTYPYNDRTNANVNLSQKILNVLGANPNAILSTNYTLITTNTMQVSRWEDQDRTAAAIINELVAAGNTAGARYLFGVYNNRQATYAAIPSVVEYQYKLLDGGEMILSMNGQEVKPFDLLPGRWLFVGDLLAGKTPALSAGLRTDPRNLFIERISYTAPWGIRIQGGKTDTLSRKLARWGTQGIGIPINRPI